MPLIALAVLTTLVLGYRFYGRFVASQYALDDARPTPAFTRGDGVDFVPTRPFYLLGQHFSAIAAAGPMAGPILACQQFGWLPCLLWIGLGVVFVGAVHDFSSLVASVRHGGRSIAEIVRLHLGPRAWLAMMAFIWVALVYVILAFTDITASTFVGRTEDLAGMAFPFNPGGAVALASLLYLILSVVMGLVERWLKPPLWLTTAVFVPATLLMVWLGTRHSTLLAGGRPHLGPPDPRLLLRRLAHPRVGAPPAPRLPGRLRPLHLPGGGPRGHLLRRLPGPAGGVQGMAGGRRDGRPLPVPVRHDRVRRVLGLPRPRVLGDDVEADREGVALPDRSATGPCCSRPSWP